MVKRLQVAIAPGGELVIGNFSRANPSRSYMELVGEWNLHHRSEDQLRELALQAGADADQLSVGREPENVNLFLHLRTAAEAIPRMEAAA